MQGFHMLYGPIALVLEHPNGPTPFSLIYGVEVVLPLEYKYHLYIYLYKITLQMRQLAKPY